MRILATVKVKHIIHEAIRNPIRGNVGVTPRVVKLVLNGLIDVLSECAYPK